MPARLRRRFPIRGVGGLRFTLAVRLLDFGIGHLGLRRRSMPGRCGSSLGRSFDRLPGGLLDRLGPALAGVVYGLALLAIVMYRPAGVWPWLAARMGLK